MKATLNLRVPFFIKLVGIIHWKMTEQSLDFFMKGIFNKASLPSDRACTFTTIIYTTDPLA